ncbi:hypothetical protein A2380_01490 [candidate division WWE3 bacterium RIFOXYB1_FULL_43_24]|uniref:RNA polymerase, sigma-24 subunit, ECF subfamily n=1 Tax=candidate division WWE3 bacterium GW2011_GWF1_42_14 TaxID=1619138 RepID=A0A0G1BJT0_UNCKA|nr:MAG: RNA polymerase, sigma-24 subunit, ECF subfamily [candidate division WWE3 bacterium GW2011_GWA1_42_12]KKS34527.1 MAG: RNA polymerase, sigma-24 subunit, ECF subfamily [candidate division WWE3 bacterium GW2011_GWD1_42_14]KKS37708.1 MAG: RNA polymerase, sigma-24 subunit, ECF subfamily [candidate division WWE3 bacterium GW2011_GWF1_42_14]KKS40151.1 MAG: RNA polymerase, sigma-24 subunit, ECF subfamily [candidate division WWE3 bacterium GW2011_GWE1_42_16]OGC59545.1 MAG: hypothetical protein A2
MDDYKNKTDEEIVELISKGNKDLYAEIIRRYQTRLMRYAQYLVDDYAKASDAVQESFIKAYINLNGFNTKKKFSSWIYRIVHNEVINIIDKHKKSIVFDESIDFDSGINVEDSYMKEELAAHTHECLDSMDLKYREPLSLYYLEDKSYEEIGDILRLPIGTVATRINRAKAIMRKICQTKTR